jgi:hypothetical protein
MTGAADVDSVEADGVEVSPAFGGHGRRAATGKQPNKGEQAGAVYREVIMISLY